MSTHGYTYKDAVALLHTFLMASPMHWELTASVEGSARVYHYLDYGMEEFRQYKNFSPLENDDVLLDRWEEYGMGVHKTFQDFMKPIHRYRLYYALATGLGDFGAAGFAKADAPITESSWYKKAIGANPISSPPAWSLDNTLSLLGYPGLGHTGGGCVCCGGNDGPSELLR